MHRSDRRTAHSQGFEGPRVHGTAGVENNSPAQFFFANPREVSRRNGDLIIGRRNQDDLRRQDLPRHSSEGLPGSNKSNGAPRAGFASGQDRANPPPRFTKPPSERSSNTSRTNDGQAILHRV